MFNYELISSITLGTAATVPIILAIVQAFKMTGWVKDKYAPFLSMAVGVVIASFLANDLMTNWSATIFSGIMFGLTASGLYSGLKTTTNAIKMERLKADRVK